MNNLQGGMSHKKKLQGRLSMPLQPSGSYQKKVVIPGDTEQVIRVDSGYTGLLEVTVAAIPSNYGKITFNGYILKVE